MNELQRFFVLFPLNMLIAGAFLLSGNVGIMIIGFLFAAIANAVLLSLFDSDNDFGDFYDD